MSEKTLHLLIGPNGSGKSRELNSLVAGSIEQTALLSWGLFSKSSSFGFLRQSSHNLQISRRIYSNLFVPTLLGGTCFKDPDKEIYELLGQFGFGYLLNQDVENLSGGELKIVQLLSELLLDRPCFIMDDPFSGLDVARRNSVKEIIRTILFKNLAGLNGFDHLIVSMTDSEQEDYEFLSHLETNKIEIRVAKSDLIEQRHYGFIDGMASCRRPRVGHIRISDLTLKIKRRDRLLFDASNVFLESGKANLINWPNGSGKTVLLNLVAGYLPKEIEALGGNIIIEDIDNLKKINDWASRKGSLRIEDRIIYVPQNCDYLLVGTTPRELYERICQVFDVGDKLKAILLDIVGPVLDKRVIIEHSLGEVRWYTIFFAMMIALTNKRIGWLILDEPDSYLDMKFQELLVTVLKLVMSVGVNLVITSHNPNIYSEIPERKIIAFKE